MTDPTQLRRVVVTGLGAVTPIGVNVADYWSSLLAGHSGVRRITRFDPSDLPVQIAGEVTDFTATDWMPRRVSRRIDPFAQYALAAAEQAVEDAKLDVDTLDPARAGVLVGSAYGPVQTIQAAVLAVHDGGPRKVSPFFPASSAIDNASGEIAMRFGVRAASGSVSTACATGSTSIGEAARMIRHGYADTVLAGGADDAITRVDIAATALAGALSRRNDDPPAASRPFDNDRDGFIMAAGAGVVVLEEAEQALRRGAPILAEVAGYGATTDVHHPTAPDPDGTGATHAIRAALADAGLSADDVDHINAHGTGTRLNDDAELKAIRAVFGPRAAQIPISAVKSMTGHTLGAAGALELIATVLAIRAGTVPPTRNCHDPADAQLDFVPDRARDHRVRVAVSNSFGFAGHNASLVVREWPTDPASAGTTAAGRPTPAPLKGEH